MNNTINSFYAKGKKNFTLYMPAPITNMEKMIMTRSKNVKCLLVGLNNGEVRLYSDKYLITTINNDVSISNITGKDITTAMKFGVYGREEGSLIMNFKSGGICVKILGRQANLTTSTHKPGPPP